MVLQGSEEERRPLLADEALRGQQHLLDLPSPPNPYANLPVYSTIHRVRQEVLSSLDDPYSLDQLRAPRINVSVVRPLVNRLWQDCDVSIIYCLLVNKLQFLREQEYQGYYTVHTTRAWLCELVAVKLLRRYDEENPGNEGLLLVSNAMVAGFKPFQNAPPEVVKESAHASKDAKAKQKGKGYQKRSSALEMAILSNSKLLISSPACQKVMDAIYVGRIVYTPSSFIDILPDRYKQKPIALYRPECAPILNQYRLMVPRTRNILDIAQFAILLILYILVMENRDYHSFTPYELVFCIYGSGWVLDELASILEHGWHCYTQNLWSFLDAGFSIIFTSYFIVRMHSLHSEDRARSGRAALDILSASAPVLIPRLAFNFMSENMLFVSLRAMMSNFIILTFLAAWCFAGFLLSLAWLSGDHVDNLTISKWMLDVWFGLSGEGIDESVSLHWVIGPVLMVAFAFLGNTLFLTILVSMLNHTFAKIASNATAEIQFRRAVLTFEGVKSDAIFAYMPPFNILAICFMLPLKLALSERWFHKVNVALIRTLNAPLLFIITVFERRNLWQDKPRNYAVATVDKIFDFSRWLFALGTWWDWSRFSPHGDIEAVFDFSAPQSVLDKVHAQEMEETTTDHSRPDTADGPTGATPASKPLSSSRPGINRRKTGTKSVKSPKRRTSFPDGNGFTADQFAEFLHEHGAGDFGAWEERLQAIEASNSRMERILRVLETQLCDANSDEAEPRDNEDEPIM